LETIAIMFCRAEGERRGYIASVKEAFEEEFWCMANNL
jgi:hypothetical protein